MSLKRQDFTATGGHRLCEDHFEDWCFEKNKEEARKAGFNKIGLVPGAYPSIFIYKHDKSPKKRRSLALTKSKNIEVCCLKI